MELSGPISDRLRAERGQEEIHPGRDGDATSEPLRPRGIYGPEDVPRGEAPPPYLAAPNLFDFDADGRIVPDSPRPGCEWVMRGEGVGLRVYDGEPVFKDKAGHWWSLDMLGRWVPITESPVLAEFGAARLASPTPDSGLYTLCGPGVRDNADGFEWPGLVHQYQGERVFPANPHRAWSFESLRDLFTSPGWRYHGVIWHAADGRRARLLTSHFRR